VFFIKLILKEKIFPRIFNIKAAYLVTNKSPEDFATSFYVKFELFACIDVQLLEVIEE